MEDLYQEIILDHYRKPKHRAPELEDEAVVDKVGSGSGR